jgi:phospholipase/carboxylesterase
MLDDQPIVLEPGHATANACVIWLHGLGADGHDFEPIVDALKLPSSMAVRFILPHAPMMPVTINNGYVMRAWYDIPTMDIGGAQDAAGIRRSARYIGELIEQQIELGIACERIVLAGFSQGGAVVLYTALRFDQPLAGVVALSTYLPLAAKLEQEKSPNNQHIPLLYLHGAQDAVVPLQLALLARSRLEEQGYTVDWQLYDDLPHGVSPAEVQRISRWLQSVLERV